MSESQILLVILAAIYLGETFFWLPKGSVAFRVIFRRGWRILENGKGRGDPDGRVHLANPFPPLGHLILCRPWPISISPVGVSSCPARAFPIGRSTPRGQYVRFDEMKSIDVSGRELSINGGVFLAATSSSLTRHLARLLTRLRELPHQQREAALEAEFARMMDISQIEARVREWRKTSWWVSWTSRKKV